MGTEHYVTANTALASSLSTHRVQHSSVDVQGEDNLTVGVLALSFGSAGIFTVHAVCCPTAAYHIRIKNRICETVNFVRCTEYLEPNTWKLPDNVITCDKLASFKND